MKVWIINHYAIPPSMGGLVRHYYFSKYLQERGHEVKIFTSSKIHNTDVNMITDKRLYLEKEVDGIEYTFVRTSNYKGNKLGRIINMLQFPIRVWRVCKKFEKPDVIYTSSPDLFTALSAVLLAKKMKLPKVMEVRDLWPESIVEFSGMSRNNPIIKVLYGVEKWLYRQADKLIFTMEGGKQYITDKGWDNYIDLGKIHHVNNGVDLREYEENKETFIIQDEDLNDEESFKIVYVGSIRQANNVGVLIKATEKINTNKKFSLLIYGDGNEREELEAYCKEYKLNFVKFKGKVEKKYIPYILSKSNLNILNYKATNLGKYGGSQNKLFEYLASGVPVYSNVEMGYSIIMGNGCGIEKNVSSEEEYADILGRFIELSKEEYEKYKENASKTISKYDYHILTDKIEKILQEAIEK